MKRASEPGAAAEVGDERAQRGREAVVVEGGRAQLAGEAQQLLHRLGRDRLGLAQLGAQVGRRVLGARLQAQEHAGQRLVGLVVEVARDPCALALLGLEDGARRPGALGLEAREHPVVGLAQPRDLLDLRPRGRHGRAARGEVDGLHRGDELLERGEAAAQDDAVGEHGREHGGDEQPEAAVVGDRVRIQVDGDGGREHRRGDQQRVDGEDLREEGRTLHDDHGDRHPRARAVAIGYHGGPVDGQTAAILSEVTRTRPCSGIYRMSVSGAEYTRRIKQQIDEVDPSEVHELVNNGVAIVDVRETEEYSVGHLPGAKHVPRGYLESRIEGAVPDRSQRVILYCASGNRSALAAHTLERGAGLRERRVDDRRHHAVEGPRLRGRGPADVHARAARALLAPLPASRRSASRASRSCSTRRSCCSAPAASARRPRSTSRRPASARSASSTTTWSTSRTSSARSSTRPTASASRRSTPPRSRSRR